MNTTVVLYQETTITYDALIETLQGSIETLSNGAVFYRNAERQLHRTHGPAVIHPNCTVAWYRNGLLHRTDGPAAVFPDGDLHWFLNAEELSEEDFRMRVAAGDYREP